MSAYYYAAFYIYIDSKHFHNWGHLIAEARGINAVIRQLGLGQGGGVYVRIEQGMLKWTVAREFV